MPARTPHSRDDGHPTWHYIVTAFSWLAIGVLGSLASIWISTLATAHTLRALMALMLVVVAYAIWFRIGRALGFIDRGIFASLQQVIDDLNPS